MAGILEKLGKDVLPVNDFAIPPTLTFLDPQNKVKQLGKDVTPEQLADREVIVVLDTTAWIQLGKMADVIRQSKAIKAVLDHHVSADDLGAELFKNTSAEATGRLVVEAADALGVPLTPRDRRNRPLPRWPPTPAGSALPRPRPTRCGWPGAWSMPARSPICFTSIFTNTTAWPACSLSDARWPGPARSLAAD